MNTLWCYDSMAVSSPQHSSAVASPNYACYCGETDQKVFVCSQGRHLCCRSMKALKVLLPPAVLSFVASAIAVSNCPQALSERTMMTQNWRWGNCNRHDMSSVLGGTRKIDLSSWGSCELGKKLTVVRASNAVFQ